MSKLESAFSKALEEQTRDHSSTDAEPVEQKKTPVSGGALARGAEKALANRSGLATLVSPRNQIKAMNEGFILSDAELQAKGIIYPRMEDVRLLNIYRNLRTKLLSAASGNNFTTLVTSVNNDAETALIAANLAASFAFDEGKTALLVEGNLHRPSLDQLFNLDSEAAGLVDYLEAEDRSVSEVIHETGISRLRFIPAGNVGGNSAEYFTSERMREAIAEIVQRYPDRYPIIEAPSVSDSADARILLDLCDQVILVVSYGKSTEQDIRTAAEIIGSEKLVGVVLDEF